jgi:hypothetical protein
MTKMMAMHSREIGLARHPVGVRRNGREWVGVRSTPDRCSDFLQRGGTLVAILWGRRGGRSDWAWSARGRIERRRGCTGPAPVTLLTRRNLCGDDGVDPTRAASCRNDGAQTMLLAQSVRRSPISDKAPDNWHRRHHLRRQRHVRRLDSARALCSNGWVGLHGVAWEAQSGPRRERLSAMKSRWRRGG